MVASQQQIGQDKRQLADWQRLQTPRVPRSILLAGPISAIMWVAIIAGVHHLL